MATKWQLVPVMVLPWTAQSSAVVSSNFSVTIFGGGGFGELKMG